MTGRERVRCRVRIFLDEDVPAGVRRLVARDGHSAESAGGLGLGGVADGPLYVGAVTRGFELVLTCNVWGVGGFLHQVTTHLRCTRRELPVPVHTLWAPDVGNNWKLLRRRWRPHGKGIGRLASRLAGTDAAARHREALDTLAGLLRRAERLEGEPQRILPV